MTVWYFLVKIAIDGVPEGGPPRNRAVGATVLLERHITHPALRIPQAPTATQRPHVEMPIRLVFEPFSTLHRYTFLNPQQSTI
ncbi:hypothetical protein [Streptomyces sp. NPDC059631]|uniref:hypothetical protein n=1 Tax=unclassified Streptomyces TaxID=2593676 RepID=UPI0036B3B571